MSLEVLDPHQSLQCLSSTSTTNQQLRHSAGIWHDLDRRNKISTAHTVAAIIVEFLLTAASWASLEHTIQLNSCGAVVCKYFSRPKAMQVFLTTIMQVVAQPPVRLWLTANAWRRV